MNRHFLLSVSRVLANAFLTCMMLQAEEKVSWGTTEIGGEKYVAVEQIQKFYGFNKSTRNESAINLEKSKISIDLEIGSPECLLNGIKIILSKPVAESGNAAYIASADLAGFLDPVLRPNHISGTGDFRIVILDPANGGFALEIANFAKSQLEAKGFTVVLTREGATDVSSEERLNLANAVKGNAVFVGISFDSGPADVNGIQTIPVARGEGVIQSDPFGSASVALSTAVHGSLIRRLGKNTSDRGVKRGEPDGLSRIKHPAILVKPGSMAHPVDSQLLANPVYQKAVSVGIVDGVGKYRFAVNSKPQGKSEEAPEP